MFGTPVDSCAAPGVYAWDIELNDLQHRNRVPVLSASCKSWMLSNLVYCSSLSICYLSMQVTFLGVSKKFTICQEAKQVNTKQNLHFECLEPHHFVPEIVETYPYEQLSHAVLNWVEENADRCDVIHGHEWGGAFVDLITANNHRQVCSAVNCDMSRMAFIKTASRLSGSTTHSSYRCHSSAA